MSAGYEWRRGTPVNVVDLLAMDAETVRTHTVRCLELTASNTYR